MKPGRRALGIAESYRGTDDGNRSTLAGVVVRADRTVDDFSFGHCRVGGHDVTASIVDLWERLDRPDVRYLFVAGVALAWYNILDIGTLHRSADRPVLAITFEESDGDGLAAGVSEAFDGRARTTRLEAIEALPERERFVIDGEPLFVRSLGLDRSETKAVLEAYTERRRPEPLRIAKRLARRVDTARRDGTITPE